GRLPALFDRRWLATDPEGLRVLACADEGNRDGTEPRGARLVRSGQAPTREDHAAQYRDLEPLRWRRITALAYVDPLQWMGRLSEPQWLHEQQEDPRLLRRRDDRGGDAGPAAEFAVP